MAQEVIDVGSSAGSGNGDILRIAFIKSNDNFTELYEISKVNIVSKDEDYNALANDYVTVSTTNSNVTVTLPTAIGISGITIGVVKVDAVANTLIIDTVLSQTINGLTQTTITDKWITREFISDGANWIIR